jgi:adenosylcobinamide amidohydrolase
MTTTLTKHASLNHTQNHIHVEFIIPHQVMSSAVLNGGIVYADHLVNLKVPKCLTAPSSPQLTLAKYCESANWNGSSGGE